MKEFNVCVPVIEMSFDELDAIDRRLVDEAREDSVKILFFQKEYDSRLASTLNESMGTRLVTINPLDYDWDGQIMLIVDELAGK